MIWRSCVCILFNAFVSRAMTSRPSRRQGAQTVFGAGVDFSPRRWSSVAQRILCSSARTQVSCVPSGAIKRQLDRWHPSCVCSSALQPWRPPLLRLCTPEHSGLAKKTTKVLRQRRKLRRSDCRSISMRSVHDRSGVAQPRYILAPLKVVDRLWLRKEFACIAAAFGKDRRNRDNWK